MTLSTDKVSLAWKDISKTIKAGNKTTALLQRVSGVVYPGEMMALMGLSGCGKTTLLQILGGRQLMGVEGNIYINGEEYSKAMRGIIGFIHQDDMFFPSPSFTIDDHMTFTAGVRLSDSIPWKEKKAKIDRVLVLLGIHHRRGCPISLLSGGEKKRCAIAAELLSDPCILILDEPTSGLDSSSAVSLLRTLRELAISGKPVIMSIHQPSYEMFVMFDKILVLHEGHPMFHGRPDECMPYCLRLGFPPIYVDPIYINPGGYIIDLIYFNYTNQLGITVVNSFRSAFNDSDIQAQISSLLRARADHCALQETHSDKDSIITQPLHNNHDDTFERVFNTCYCTQFNYLFLRSAKAGLRTQLSIINVTQALIIGAVTGLFWFQTDNYETDVFSVTSFLYFITAYWFFNGMFNGLTDHLPERCYIARERQYGSYHISAFYFAKLFSNACFRIILVFPSYILAYMLAVRDADYKLCLAQCGLVVLSTFVSDAIGLTIATLQLGLEASISVATLVTLSMMLLGGFYIQNLPPFLDWLKYLSPFRFSYNASVQIQFLSGSNVICEGGIAIYKCYFQSSLSGQEIVDILIKKSLPLYDNLFVLIGMMLVFYTMAYIFIRYITPNTGRK